MRLLLARPRALVATCLPRRSHLQILSTTGLVNTRASSEPPASSTTPITPWNAVKSTANITDLASYPPTKTFAGRMPSDFGKYYEGHSNENTQLGTESSLSADHETGLTNLSLAYMNVGMPVMASCACKLSVALSFLFPTRRPFA